MRRLLVFAVMLGVLAALGPANAAASGSVRAVKVHRPGSSQIAHHAGLGANTVVAKKLHVRQWHPASHVSNRAITLSGSVKTFTRTINDGGTPFTYTMIGKDPFVTQSNPVTNVKTWVIDVVFNNGSDTFDPNASDPCDPATAGALYRTINSPIFKKKKYKWGGTPIGNGAATQYVDAFQRSEFWSQTKPTGINPGYNTNVKLESPLLTSTFYTTSGWPEYTGGCEPLLEVDINTFDSSVQSSLIPAAAGSFPVGPKTFPLILVHNVVFYDGTPSNCCILGYHNAYSSPVQTYGVADFDTTGAFGASVHDVSAMSHEVAEWMNDPTTNNPTKPWGHIGQVSGCQGNLEVGDPLSGTVFGVPLGGFNYTVQEMAFFSWFYHQSPSIGVNGWYSNQGTFTSPALPCS